MFDICDVVTVCGVLGYIPGDKPTSLPQFALFDEIINCIVEPDNVIPVGLLPPTGYVIG
jgi:hypothetical protein